MGRRPLSKFWQRSRKGKTNLKSIVRGFERFQKFYKSKFLAKSIKQNTKTKQCPIIENYQFIFLVHNRQVRRLHFVHMKKVVFTCYSSIIGPTSKF